MEKIFFDSREQLSNTFFIHPHFQIPRNDPGRETRHESSYTANVNLICDGIDKWRCNAVLT